jgi:hypothetical protein
MHCLDSFFVGNTDCDGIGSLLYVTVNSVTLCKRARPVLTEWLTNSALCLASHDGYARYRGTAVRMMRGAVTFVVVDVKGYLTFGASETSDLDHRTTTSRL